MSQLPQGVEAFLQDLIRRYDRGERDQHFAEWAAVGALLLLELGDLLDCGTD